MTDIVHRHPKWMQGAIAESRRLELQFSDQIGFAFHGLAEVSSGLRKLFGGMRPELDHQLDELDAVISALRPEINVVKLDQIAPHQQILLAAFEEASSLASVVVLSVSHGTG